MDALHRFAAVVVITAGLVVAVPADRVGAAQKTLATSEAWVKLPSTGDSSATAFVVIDNPTMYDVYIVSASSEVAGEVQFRQKSAAPDAAAEAVQEIAAPAYGQLQLTADGVHIVLLNLKRALKEGEIVTLAFTTDGGLTLHAPAVVRKP